MDRLPSRRYSVSEDCRRRLKETIQAIAIDCHTFKLTTFYVDRLSRPQPFNPSEAYASLYQIDAESIAQTVYPSLRPHFLDLRLQLEYAYIDLSLNSDWSLYDGNAVEPIQQHAAELDRLGLNWDSRDTLLPLPTSNQLLTLLQSDRFVSILYKLNKVETILQQQNDHLSSVAIVQTTVAVDGHINNSCWTLNRAEAHTILALHQKSIILGQIEWQKWLNFLINVCRII